MKNNIWIKLCLCLLSIEIYASYVDILINGTCLYFVTLVLDIVL